MKKIFVILLLIFIKVSVSIAQNVSDNEITVNYLMEERYFFDKTKNRWAEGTMTTEYGQKHLVFKSLNQAKEHFSRISDAEIGGIKVFYLLSISGTEDSKKVIFNKTTKEFKE
jgi:predicted membrane-bound dolichyl-phosphate-mannose-protein mannosyltransferase